jgi:hypothetical protein
MLIKEFLKNVTPALPVTVWDLDAQPGNNKKEDEAGALAIAHHFDYNSEVLDFYIEPDKITLFIKRQ